MGAKKFSHAHRSTMCGLKNLASGVFSAAAEMDQKQIPRLPGVT